MKKILITGATGYIGSKVVKQLVAKDPSVAIMTLNRDPEKAIQLLPFAQCDHRSAHDAEAVRAFCPDVVLHLAALSTARCDEAILQPLIEANIEYGVWLLNTLATCSQKSLTFVNTGSFAEYRLGEDKGLRPAYLYTATKAAFRQFLQFYKDLTGMRVLTAIPYSVYGGITTRKQLMDYMMESINSSVPVDMTQGEQVLDFVHVDDIVRFYVGLALNPDALPEGDYHLGTGKGTSVQALAGLIAETIGKDLNIRWGRLPYRPLDVMNAIALHNATLAAFWQPKISLKEGIRGLVLGTQDSVPAARSM